MSAKPKKLHNTSYYCNFKKICYTIIISGITTRKKIVRLVIEQKFRGYSLKKIKVL